jgi:hypothetical protein
LLSCLAWGGRFRKTLFSVRRYVNDLWRIVAAQDRGATVGGVRNLRGQEGPVVIWSDRWEVLERIGAYAASELSPQEAREVEQMILEDPEALRLAESYLRMLALLDAVGEESSQAPQAVIDHAIRRATISAFFRQAEFFFAGIGRAYLDAFVHYLGLRDPGPVARGIS